MQMQISPLHGFAFVFFILIAACILHYSKEGFTSIMDDGSVPPTPLDGWDLSSHTAMENAHGSAPAGVHASPGSVQRVQNKDAPHVSVIKGGNPQNVWPDLKMQPTM